jgi:hypothetical protein
VTTTQFKAAIQNYVERAGRILYMEICEEYCNTTWSHTQIRGWMEEMEFPLLDDGTPNPDKMSNPLQGGWNAKILYNDKVTLEKERRSIERPFVIQAGCFTPCSEKQCPDSYNNGRNQYVGEEREREKASEGESERESEKCVVRERERERARETRIETAAAESSKSVERMRFGCGSICVVMLYL